MQPVTPAELPSCKHICFVALAAWPLLSGDRTIRSVGGAEAQQCILARSLVGRGYRVTMVCMDFGQPDGVVVDGIEVYRAHAPNAGIPGLRFFHPRLTAIWAAMARANADLYYQRACGSLTGIVAAFCQKHDKSFVYAAAHDADFDRRLPLIRLGRDRALYVWGLRRADAIAVQSPAQESLCRENFGLASRPIASCYSLAPGGRRDPGGYVLWVATMRTWKRPDVFIELAARLPQFRFRMVGGPEDPAYYDELRLRALQVPNLEFVGFVPYADIEQHFDGARVFVNTSETEGFPNTFLQSWARGIPTISFLDPGSRFNDAKIVSKAGNFDEMTRLVSELMDNDLRWEEAGRRTREYFLQHHSPATVAQAYEALFAELRTSGHA